ncbi:unnamed protein product, partial [Symbiodinium sp. KB8]
MREFQDFSSVAVPLPAGPALSPAEASPSQELLSVHREDLCSVAFDATSFDILSVSAAFKKLCFENGFEDIADGMSIFDLSPGKHPNSLAGYIQTAVNALEPEKLEGDLLMIRDLELFGNTKVRGFEAVAVAIVLLAIVLTMLLRVRTDKMLDAILGVEALCIVFLQGITAATLCAAFLQSLWRGQLPDIVVQMQYGLCSLRDRWTQKPKPKPGNARVEAKFVDTLCKLLTNGCRVVVVALFLRLLAIQGPLLKRQNHQLQPSLDVSNIISYPIVLFLVIFHHRAISCRTLDIWYVLLQTLCVIPLLWTAPADVTSVSLITLLPRVMLGLCPKRGWLPVIGMSFELSTRTIELSAVSGLLLGYCDAVVEVDSSLKLTDDSRQFSTLLLHGHGISAGSLAGYDFLSFFHVDDREHISMSLGAKHESTQALALNARMQDCLGNFVKVEILFTSFQNADGQECRLVGMREFQDFNSVAVPLPMGPVPLAALRRFRGCSVSLQQDKAYVDACSVAFDATSFDILSLSAGFQKLCLENGADDISEGMSIFDLSTGNDPASLAGYIQTAVNSLEPDKLEGDLLLIRDVVLFGTTKVQATLQFQTDKMLDAIIGNLCIDATPPTMTLTATNLAKLNGHRQRRGSNRSRSSKSSRSSRRRRSGETGEHFFTALTLAVHVYKCIRRKELPKFLRYVRAAYLRCRDMLGNDARDARDRCMEKRVNRKFHETLCNLLVAGSNLMVIVLFFRLSVYQWHLLTNANHLLSPALDISSVAGYAVVLFMISFRQLVIPRSLDLWYFALQ